MRSLRQADAVTVARSQDESLDLAAFPGTWTSSDPGTRGVARLDLAVCDGELVGRIWGGGADGPVDWGASRAEALYADAVTSRAGAGFLLRYDHGFLTSHVEANLKLGVAVLGVYQSFKDGSGRQDYFFREFLSADGSAVRQRYGNRSEKLVEFGLQPLRSRPRSTKTEPDPPATPTPE